MHRLCANYFYYSPCENENELIIDLTEPDNGSSSRALFQRGSSIVREKRKALFPRAEERVGPRQPPRRVALPPKTGPVPYLSITEQVLSG